MGPPCTGVFVSLMVTLATLQCRRDKYPAQLLGMLSALTGCLARDVFVSDNPFCSGPTPGEREA